MIPPELDPRAGLMDVDPSDDKIEVADLGAVLNKDLMSRVNAFKTVGADLKMLGGH